MIDKWDSRGERGNKCLPSHAILELVTAGHKSNRIAPTHKSPHRDLNTLAKKVTWSGKSNANVINPCEWGGSATPPDLYLFTLYSTHNLRSCQTKSTRSQFIFKAFPSVSLRGNFSMRFRISQNVSWVKKFKPFFTIFPNFPELSIRFWLPLVVCK